MSKSFYIQVRGKKQGPYTVERLRHMARQGRFGRQHRISTNGKKWQSAEDFPELFNADGERKTRQSAASGNHGGGGAAAAVAPGTGATGESEGWFYSHDGQQFGPASFEVIRHARQTGSLKRDDLVWTAGMPEWKQADKAFPGLFDGKQESGDVTAAAAGANAVTGSGEPAEGAVTLQAPMSNMALYCLILSFVPVIGSIPAVVCGHKALNEIYESESGMDGRNLALIGLTLSYLVLGAGVLWGLFTLSSTMFSGSPAPAWDPALG